MVIRWRTDNPTSSRVWYGDSPSNLNFSTTDNGSNTDHEVTISGLPANSTFYYAVGNASGQFTTPGSEYYFKTSPPPGSSEPASIWVLGDAGKDNDHQRSVRDAFYAYNGGHHADVILALGDNAYSDGTDEEYQYAWFENMFESTLINSVVWPCPGNHDIRSANSVAETGVYYDIFTLPRNGEAGGTPSGTEAYYSFDYGNIHFVSLNSEDIDHSPSSPMLAWLQQDLAANTQLWVVVILHRVIYHSQTLADFRENFVPVLEAGGADLVMYGHQHSYRRSYLIDGHYGSGNGSFDANTMAIDAGDGRPDGDGAYQKPSSLTPNAGTIYMVTGSAGTVSPLPSPITFMPYEAGEPEGLGSVHVSVSGGQMDVKFINYQDQILDYFTISKQLIIASPPTVSVTAPAHGTNYTTPQAVTVTANASDSDGSVTQVEFFVNNTSIGVDDQAPYSIDYTPPGNGAYNVVASATDNDNNTTSSPVVQFTVGPVTTCVRIDNGDDDAEERPSGTVSLASGDLELVVDGDPDGQTVGLRFNGLNIPQGANIASAHLQFTVDENTNDNPCSLTIYGQASDNASAFSGQDFSISSLPRANASVSWTPSDWLAVGDAGFAQQSPNITSIIQEIVSRPGFSANSSIALFIEGMGRRTAESYEGGPSVAPELCIEWSMAPIDFDCPNIPANIGASCDDGDNTTLNDMIDANCNCVGAPTACTGIGDADGDGVCDDVDCDDLDANITHQPGDACDDGNLATINDMYDANCNCVGVLNGCPGIGDADGDGICADIDCDDNDPNSTSIAGDACDDGDNTTINDRLDNNCNCAGTPTACTGIGDNDGDGICADVDCDDNDPNSTSQPGDPCDDGDNTTLNDAIDNDCNCTGAPTICTGFGDNDGDGVCADVDCDDNDPNNTSQAGDACNDGDNTTINDTIDSNCNCAGTPTACTGLGDADGDGVCADVDCDDNDPNITSQ
ncbi:MAG: metallophosphoesterase, partial [Phaeodactylibacter sp.]|nr:metallophosphoesterase [Phaeodactylibacter sp.]